MSSIDTIFVLCQTGLQRRDRRSPCAARQAARLLGVNLGETIFPATDDPTHPRNMPAVEIWTTRCGAKVVLLVINDWLEASLVSGAVPCPAEIEDMGLAAPSRSSAA